MPQGLEGKKMEPRFSPIGLSFIENKLVSGQHECRWDVNRQNGMLPSINTKMHFFVFTMKITLDNNVFMNSHLL